ncbi:MAG: insulinase family protein [Fusobacteriaceae bacterium]
MKNGLTYYILENKKPENRASLHLIYSIGSIQEEDNQRGIAHFLEHMAFNGTKSYPKNDLIKYFQSIGLSFGRDLNAHTGFNETVYKLKIPINSSNQTTNSSLKTGFKVLKEWSSDISLEEKDVIDERNIILEEWRLTQGLTQRISDARRKNIFGDSKYSERFPIGTPESIKTTTNDELLNFYKKWYVPQNSAIIAVGDFKETDIENYIKYFFSDLTVHENKSKIDKPFLIGDTKDSYSIFRDSELVNSNFDISFLTNVEPTNNNSQLKEEVINLLWENILNSRIDILKKQINSPIFSGKIYSYQITPKEKIITFSSRLDENKIPEGINLIYKNLKILSEYGPDEIELKNEKEELISYLKINSINSDSIENEEYMEEIKELFLYDNTFLNPEDKLNYLEKILPQITILDIQNKAFEFLHKESSKFLSLPKKDSLNSLNEDTIKNIYMYTMNNNFENESFSSKVVLEKQYFTPGKIISKNKYSDYYEYELSNGIKVKYKQTNFEKDKIYFKLFKSEGSSNDNDLAYFNSLVTPFMMNSSGIGNLSVEETMSFMKGKNFELAPYLNDYEQGIEIFSDEENLELAIDSGIILLTKPNFSLNVFQNLKLNLSQQIENSKNSPRAFYSDEISKVLNQNNIRRIQITEENLKLIKEEDIKNLYKNKFSNYDGYKLVSIGSLPPEKFEELLINKISSLPAKSSNSQFKPLNIKYPKDIVTKKIIKGQDKKVTTTLIFPLNSNYTFENKNLGDTFSELLNILLLKNIREGLGGVYSIRSRANISYTNYGENYLSISFSTDLEKSHIISKAVHETFNNILLDNYSKLYLEDIWKNYELNYETSRNKNEFWFSYLYSSFFSIEDFKNLSPQEYKNITTSKNLNNFLKKAFNKNNYLEITLVPEKN